jgi:hypothetical protein
MNENELLGLINQYEINREEVEELRKEFEETDAYKKYNAKLKPHLELFDSIKAGIKEIYNDNVILSGKNVAFSLQIRHNQSRTYDINKIKTDKTLAGQVITESVNQKVFEILEKSNLIPNATDYYKKSEEIVKAVTVKDVVVK